MTCLRVDSWVNFLVKGQKYSGIMNFGVKPTINSSLSSPVTETFIFEFDQDIYGEKIVVYFIDYIRSEMKFHSVEELRTQMQKDIEVAKEKYG